MSRLAVRAAIFSSTLIFLSSAVPGQFPQPESPVMCPSPGPTTMHLVYGDYTVGCTINAATETDTFTFGGNAGDKVLIAVITGTFLDPRIRVLDPTPPTPTFLVDQSCTGACSMEIALTLPNTATYTVFVSDAGANEGGAYQFSVHRVPPLTSPPGLAYGVPVNDMIDFAADIDFLTFSGVSGQILDLTLHTATFLDPRVRIFDPNGMSMVDSFCSGGCSFIIPLNLTVTGEYLVLISDNGLNEGGTYQLTLQCLFSPTGCIPSQTLNLAVAQPGGPGSISIANASGIPNAPFITVITADPLNATSPGQGWWGGLHIPVTEWAAEVLSGRLPFVGNLDGNGASNFTLPPGALPPGLPTTYILTRTLSQSLNTITFTSNIAAITPL